MATVGQVYYNIVDQSSGGYISSGIDIFSDIISAYGATSFSKLGIQAPPGTQVVLNGSKQIIIGRTGMYELDEDITITSIYFIRTKNYVLDEDATAAALLAGAQAILAAENTRKTAIAALGTASTSTTYIDAYNAIQETYEAAYEAALNTYNSGVAGIYELDGDDPYQDLFNVIVDFIWD